MSEDLFGNYDKQLEQALQGFFAGTTTVPINRIIDIKGIKHIGPPKSDGFITHTIIYKLSNQEWYRLNYIFQGDEIVKADTNKDSQRGIEAYLNHFAKSCAWKEMTIQEIKELSDLYLNKEMPDQESI
jgi:hypothetical protein